MTCDDMEFERRRQRAFERLGTNEPRCAICGYDDWRCLELHHIADGGSGKTVMIVCANHHRIISDAHKDHPPHFVPADPLLYEIGRFLCGLAELLKLAVLKLMEFGRELIERARVAPAAPAAGTPQ